MLHVYNISTQKFVLDNASSKVNKFVFSFVSAVTKAIFFLTCVKNIVWKGDRTVIFPGSSSSPL